MRKFFIFLIAVIVFASLVYAQELSCDVKSSCLSNESCVFSMYQLGNSHAGTCDAYGNDVCCSLDGENISTEINDTICSENYDLVVSLKNTTNSHVSSFIQNYDYKVCLGSQDYNITCHANDNGIADGSCDQGICVATIYQYNNSHVSDCVTDPYTISICCGVGIPEGCDFGEVMCAEGTCAAPGSCGSLLNCVEDELCDDTESCNCEDCDGFQNYCKSGLYCDYDNSYCSDEPDISPYLCSGTGELAPNCLNQGGSLCWLASVSANVDIIGGARCCGDDAGETWSYRTGYYIDDLLVDGTCYNGYWYTQNQTSLIYYNLGFG